MRSYGVVGNTGDSESGTWYPGTYDIPGIYWYIILMYHTWYVRTPFAVEGSADGVCSQKSLSSIEGQLSAEIPRCDPMV